jgi:hypothetical protein
MAGKQRAGEGSTIPDGFNFTWALKTLQEKLADKPDTPEPGFFTTEQWATAWRLSIPHTSRLIRYGVAKGNVDRADYRINASKRKVPHYRIKE